MLTLKLSRGRNGAADKSGQVGVGTVLMLNGKVRGVEARRGTRCLERPGAKLLGQLALVLPGYLARVPRRR